MTRQINSINFPGIDKYVVDASAANGSYTTIAQAITAATATGGTVWINPGTYVENLVIPGGVNLIGNSSVGSSAVIISGNATITNYTGNLGLTNLTLTAGSGTTLAISSNTSVSKIINITGCTIANTNASGIAVSAVSTGTGNFTVLLAQSQVQSSGIGVSSNGVMTLSTGYTIVAGGAGAAYDLTGATTCYSYWSNIQSTASYLYVLRSSTTVLSVAYDIGGSALEVVNFIGAATSVGFTDVTFTCSAASGNWAIGTGAITYGNVKIVGTAQGIASTIFKIPLPLQPKDLTGQAITTSQSLFTNNAYYVTSGALSLPLPTSSSVGDKIELMLSGGASWAITQAAGQSIVFGNQSTTTGTGGSLASQATGDAVSLRCVVANTRWQVMASQGNPTLV
jgi:hypothetical protein